MKVLFVGAGPGAPDLLTVAADRLIRNAKICVYAGSLVSPKILELLPQDALKHDSAKMTLDEIVEVYKTAHDANLDVLRLHSGDPSIYGSIGEQMSELDHLGIKYSIVPGVSSFQAAAAAVHTELTAPEVSQTIILTRCSGRTPLPPTQELEKLARSKATLCIFLSAAKIRQIAQMLSQHYGDDCPAAVVYRASWPEQRIYRGSLSDVRIMDELADLRKTTMFIVGHALARNLPNSKLYDRSFSHGFRCEGAP